MSETDHDTDEFSEEVEGASQGRLSLSSSLITQGKYKFYVLSMPIDVLAKVCTVSRREEDPERGFQRLLDINRAKQIAEYIDKGIGTIPSAVILSAQPKANLVYTRSKRSIAFDLAEDAFFVLDGQHRVYGFRLAQTKLRVPVVIYNNLSLNDEARIFIDINTKQRPVPNELLLDIKSLAETESDIEQVSGELFDMFNEDQSSALLGLLTSSSKVKGKISRVTFYAATKPLIKSFIESESSIERIYQVLNSYITAFSIGLRERAASDSLTNPIIFRAIMLLFKDAAQRTQDRYDRFSFEDFYEVLSPIFDKSKEREISFKKPGTSHIAFKEKLLKGMDRPLRF